MLDTIWNGIKSIFVNGVRFVVSAVKATWEVLKFACKAVVWVVAGMFTIAGHLASYVGKTLNALFKPKEVVVIPPRKVPALVSFLEDEAKRDGIADDPDVLEINNQIKEAADKNQSLIFATGEDSNGNVAVSDPEFVSATSYDSKIAAANDSNKIYRKRVTIKDKA
jgi:hypothetical protein